MCESILSTVGTMDGTDEGGATTTSCSVSFLPLLSFSSFVLSFLFSGKDIEALRVASSTDFFKSDKVIMGRGGEGGCFMGGGVVAARVVAVGGALEGDGDGTFVGEEEEEDARMEGVTPSLDTAVAVVEPCSIPLLVPTPTPLLFLLGGLIMGLE